MESGDAEAFNNVIGAHKPAVSAALAFYMKPGERPNSFEFLHKTFAEYLVARRFVEVLATMAKDFYADQHRQRGVRKSFDANNFLQSWLRLAGPRAIDTDLL